MKACIIQPPYSRDINNSDEFFEYKMKMLSECDNQVDIIVMPEYSELPCATSTYEETIFYHDKYFPRLMEESVKAAKRCDAVVFFNALCRVGDEYRNTTYAINRQGEVAGKYFKTHIPKSEKELGIASKYTEEIYEPYTLEIDGLRYGFLTCYDFYFYEAFPRIARKNVDIIIGCSLQRSDSHSAIEIMCRFLAYNTNAYVIRSSVSFDESSSICGASMVVSPTGEVLANMLGRFGKEIVEFDPGKKFYKPAGYGGSEAPHYEYIEAGRRPWQYRPGGSSVVLDDDKMPYPRVCAHRGFNSVAPENTMPAYGEAVSLGAEEIEFDLWSTKDGVLVSMHDCMLESYTSGEGNVWEYTYEELQKIDFGAKYGENYHGMKVTTFEDILKKYSCRVIMNIHIKIWDQKKEDLMMEKIFALIQKYDCEKHVYIMSTNDDALKRAKEYAPWVNLCVGHDDNRRYEIVERAIEIGAQKVQFFKPYFNREMVEKAHQNGIKCNVFWSDDEDSAKEYLKMGIDTILTNDYLKIAQVVEKFKKQQN